MGYEMSRGRKPGYKHSQETKDKMREAKTGTSRPPAVREKIRRSLKGVPHPEERKDSIAQGKALYELDEKCAARLEELKATYPEQEDFFLDNEEELLLAMQDIRTEKELTDIRMYVETASLRPEEPYKYSSSSCYAAEDAMIALLDFKRLAQKYPLSTKLF